MNISQPPTWFVRRTTIELFKVAAWSRQEAKEQAQKLRSPFDTAIVSETAVRMKPVNEPHEGAKR